jgi:hypothetical protein
VLNLLEGRKVHTQHGKKSEFSFIHKCKSGQRGPDHRCNEIIASPNPHSFSSRSLINLNFNHQESMTANEHKVNDKKNKSSSLDCFFLLFSKPPNVFECTPGTTSNLLPLPTTVSLVCEEFFAQLLFLVATLFVDQTLSVTIWQLFLLYFQTSNTVLEHFSRRSAPF